MRDSQEVASSATGAGCIVALTALPVVRFSLIRSSPQRTSLQQIPVQDVVRSNIYAGSSSEYVIDLSR